ncbi:MAG: Killer protein [Holophagales bacterium]|nr:Killer protein [Holophagales bacterium]MYG29422.1 Killer protein [Holophagales bacterium]MYI80060.1 Killer protein [Holophagales bacterium]
MEIRHKGLRQFALTGSRRGIPAAMASKLRRILSDLESAGSPTDLPAPAYRLHRLHGDLAGYWSIRVTGNWRVICRWKNGVAVDIDLVDYH